MTVDGSRRVQSDGNGGHFIRVDKREWGRLLAAVSIVLGATGYAAKTVVDDVLNAARDAPRQDYRITVVEEKVETLESGFDELNGTLVRLTTVLETIEARIGEFNNGNP